MKYAIIDIGSNSIRYMVQGSTEKLVITTRLGSGLAATGNLQRENMERSISVITALANNARHAGFFPVAYATSAVRDAGNQKEFLAAVFKSCGIFPDVLSGEREALYAYNAAAGASKGLIDIGGASMQLISDGIGKSFPIGCVRGHDIALSETSYSDCDENFHIQRMKLEEYMDEIVKTPSSPLSNWMGVGGSITTLAALKLGITEFNVNIVDNTVLNRQDIESLIDFLLTLGKERRTHPLLKKRHDVILYGAAILAKAMDMLGISFITVSTRDGMEGYLNYIINNPPGSQHAISSEKIIG